MQLSESCFFGRCFEYKIICSSFKDFRQQSPRVSHTSVDERFLARSKIITKNSVCIRGIKKRELVDMYRDDFQNILRKQRPSLFILGSFIQPMSYVADQGPLSEIWWHFSRVDKTKNSESTAIRFQQLKIVDLETCSAKRHVFPLRCIFSQAK